ncbi:hypothetical protein HBI56_028180 [Parastagonospora nodorum]|uniref:Uncharacterized protein n=2 Tax=Phaeosphaeria nodorum (strain SN15 / ATCC MYA-4574 / FGSC 10173) TaxID=321614 RepID=A0A7U2EXQ3_PHANO|nr:hypothetical protein HBH56_015830 [Parastagonospora nodorum]QRC95051.1 hypothetical protein JI435_027820 [Parastagonospora nodorum SN15]KAH3936794.1 hypothetical protein HBH54_018620 [Parastagonospora nodorum]KAH3953912.1 hypothetical protein HBH53_031010 [Parastagonospora nodorum]KAH3969358.1 hypothetical protein HBH51_123180 [Parastagonospora nodorum]
MSSKRTSTATTRPLSTVLSPLKQHPIPLNPPSPHAMQTVFLDHPTARLSSSPASSPRIVDPYPLRRGSVYPAMSDTMERGIQPGADFFDDGSSDSDWEDTEGEITRTFSDMDGMGLGTFMHGARERPYRSSRGRSRERSMLTALPEFRQLPSQRSGINMSMEDRPGSDGGKRAERAREVSLRRLSKDSVRVVHNRSSADTPRGSLRSNSSSPRLPFSSLPRLFPSTSNLSTELPHAHRLEGRQRSNTADSIIAGSIIDAHVMTMRALESLNDSPSGILTNSNSRTFGPSSTVADFPKFSSFTNDRHITMSPLSTKHAGRDRERPANLPSHFIRTPYPFTAKKVFPKPKSRPRQHAGTDRSHSAGPAGSSVDRLDSGYDDDSQKEFDDRKGKHVLGLMASEGHYDLRSRLERNEDAQGVIRSRSDSGNEGRDSTVWLSLHRKTHRQPPNDPRAPKLVKVTVPSSLTASSPMNEKHAKGPAMAVEFDDKFLADRLRDGYRSLTGTWFHRFFSARILKDIRLGQINTWSGTTSQPSSQSSGLLAAGAGIDVDADARSPFTEDSLLNLYYRPTSGKARYTWVHWAQRVASTNSTQRRKQSVNNSFRFPEPPGSENELPDSVTTIQFVQSYSTLRILSALALMLLLSVAAALLWIFVGTPGSGIRSSELNQRSDRVGSGMAIGILVLLIESLGFGAWVWCS